MTGPVRGPDRSTIEAQWRASDPRASAWVRANAGAGKTYVLAQRVLRLLLAGTEPSRLLCITYTKAAASEMANRVFDRVAAWTVATDAALAAEIEGLEGRPPSPETLVRARRLFAAAVETPGGLKIQTIHAFCERLLQQFPFEASVTAGFAVLDERAAAELLVEARNAVVVGAQQDARLAAELDHLLVRLSDTGISDLLRGLAGRRGILLEWIRQAGDLDTALDDLQARVGLGPGEDEAAIVGAILDRALVPRSEWGSVAAWMRQGSSTDGKSADRLEAAAGAGEDGLEDYLSVFLTGSGSPRKSVVTKGLAGTEPELAARLEAERDRVAALAPRLAAARLFRLNRALLSLGDAVIQRYQSLKGLRGLVDFDDLVERTAMLLTRTDAAWILYKLDGGIDHILVDEAQDTSPRQWEIVAKMASEFFAGAGARPAHRTIFAVGDVKQSIYSFQGAEPARFFDMRRHFEAAATGSGQDFRRVPLQLSFRSTPTVLGAVDAVFAAGSATEGIVAPEDGEAVVHEAVRRNEPGLVEIWPVAEPEPVADVTPWDAPLDAERAGSPPARIAERIAQTIRRWIDTGERLASTGARIGPGDIMILVARRKPFAEPMIRALKAKQIPVAGADRMVLTEHIAAMDLMAVGRFALMPEDDLTLAALLKSPLIGLDEDGLMRLAAGRRGSLWAALSAAAQSDPTLSEIRDRLAEWRRRAGFERPYEFYARLLGADRGRAAFHARLGAESFEAIDEFLGLALSYERAETASLPGFLAWLEAVPAEIKRDMDKGRDEVRVMTVHGAKGLEAPIVFLPDTCRPAGGRGVGPLFDFGPGAPLVWAPSKAEDCEATAALRAAAEQRRVEETNRLLYVAMTRARDRLYVAGFRTGTRATSTQTWYDLIGNALAGQVAEVETPEGPALRHVGEGDTAPDRDLLPATAEMPLPGWLRADAAGERARSAPLAPSRLAEHDAPAGMQRREGRAAAMRRGTVLHRMLEALPDIAPAERRDAASRALAVLAPDWPEDLRRAAVDEALAVLDDPVFAPVFAPGGRAEASIAGPAGPEGAMLVGQIDRLAVLPDAVLIVDFKTDRRFPADAAGVPPAYVAQLGAYRALAERLWPGRTVRTALLWTAGPALMEIG